MLLFQNHQWAVTERGMCSLPQEAADSCEIIASRLLAPADRGAGYRYEWPILMAERRWVDIEAFVEAFRKALQLHNKLYKGSVNQNTLSASIEDARREAQER